MRKRSFWSAGVRPSAGSFCGRKKMKGKWEGGWREHLHTLKKGPGWSGTSKGLKNSAEQVRTGENRSGRDWDLLGKTAARVQQVDGVKLNLNWVWGLWFMVIYWSLKGNRRTGARPNSSLLSSWRKTTGGTTSYMKKENWISVKNNNFYRFSFYCQSTTTQGKCNEVPYSHLFSQACRRVNEITRQRQLNASHGFPH